VTYQEIKNAELWTRKSGMGSHQSPQMKKDEWLTPPYILKALGEFHLDPCSPKNRPWDTAKKHYTIDDNGLMQKWDGRVWLNPPYGHNTSKWLAKLANHGNGIALIFSRTETKTFFSYVWNMAHALFFFKGRLYFYHSNGQKSPNNAGAPSALVAYGEENAVCLAELDLLGQYIHLRQEYLKNAKPQ